MIHKSGKYPGKRDYLSIKGFAESGGNSQTWSRSDRKNQS